MRHTLLDVERGLQRFEQLLQLDDSADGLHEHLLPGDGEIDFAAVIAAAHRIGFTGLASLELRRHRHDPARTACEALERLRG